MYMSAVHDCKAITKNNNSYKNICDMNEGRQNIYTCMCWWLSQIDWLIVVDIDLAIRLYEVL